MRYIYNLSGAVFLALVLLMAGAFSGCVKLDRPSLDRKYYTIDVKRDSNTPAKEHSAKNLIVSRVKISPRYEGRDLVYKIGANAFESDYYNSFFVPPASMITQEMRGWLSDSRLFAHVLAPESMGVGDYLLEGVVNSIYGDYSGDKPKAVLKMQFLLLDNSKPELPIIYSRDFSREIPVQGDGAGELVKAMNIGAKDIFAELETDLDSVIMKAQK